MLYVQKIVDGTKVLFSFSTPDASQKEWYRFAFGKHSFIIESRKNLQIVLEMPVFK